MPRDLMYDSIDRYFAFTEHPHYVMFLEEVHTEHNFVHLVRGDNISSERVSAVLHSHSYEASRTYVRAVGRRKYTMDWSQESMLYETVR